MNQLDELVAARKALFIFNHMLQHGDPQQWDTIIELSDRRFLLLYIQWTVLAEAGATDLELIPQSNQFQYRLNGQVMVNSFELYHRSTVDILKDEIIAELALPNDSLCAKIILDLEDVPFLNQYIQYIERKGATANEHEAS